MVNILLERYLGQSTWLYEELNAYLRPQEKVCVVAFSFRDNRVRTPADWEALYGAYSNSVYYPDIVRSFGLYGIEERNVTFLNYFTDTGHSAREKVRNADVLYFLGGLPDRMYDRLVEFDLLDVLAAHQGVAIGYSAGALIQFAEYHLSADADYPEFGFYKGIPYLRDFYLEVHYERSVPQLAAIRRVLVEHKQPVYATSGTGAIIVDNGRIKTFGDVALYAPDEPCYNKLSEKKEEDFLCELMNG